MSAADHRCIDAGEELGGETRLADTRRSDECEQPADPFGGDSCKLLLESPLLLLAADHRRLPL